MDFIKFENISDDMGLANGTSLQGYLRNITTNQLREIFGKPNMVPSGDGKVTCEWIIKTTITRAETGETEDGLFTLYDWKGSRPYNDDEEWTINVGGHSSWDYMNCLDARDIAERTDFLYAYNGDGKICNDEHNLHLLEMCVNMKEEA